MDNISTGGIVARQKACVLNTDVPDRNTKRGYVSQVENTVLMYVINKKIKKFVYYSEIGVHFKHYAL